ncbi:MAG: sigma factor-like helix-turn-helix DNA-binding protein [Candidatus Paceibacterota bacterium]|jgi:hypothetical protein
MSSINFKSKQVVKHLITALPERGRDIITSRFGLGKDFEKMTLEAIGKKYGITRERVRQIENYALAQIKKSKNYKDEADSFAQLSDLVHSLGGIISEKDLLNHVAKDKSIQNQIHFMLVLGDAFFKEKEDEEFQHRWHVDHELSKKIHESLRKLYKSLSDEDIVPESDFVETFLEHLKDVSDKYKDEEVIKRWLALSKNIGRNPLGEWGKASSSNIKAKGIRDYAYLVLRRHGSPIHFREVAKQIGNIFSKKAHVATTHNELIKDPRFVLVGRGLYALKEWGYAPGVVRDVIRAVIEKNGPMVKKDVIDKVLKERYVKENTIVVNLQNPKYFKKDKEGRYAVA